MGGEVLNEFKRRESYHVNSAVLQLCNMTVGWGEAWVERVAGGIIQVAGFKKRGSRTTALIIHRREKQEKFSKIAPSATASLPVLRF